MKTQILYNPFIYIAGYKSLLFGSAIILLTSLLAWITGTHQTGLLQFRLASDTPFVYYLLDHSINWVLTFLFLFLAGIIFSQSSIRVIDIAGTSAMARAPLILLPLIRFIPAFKSFMAGFNWHLLTLFILYVIVVIWCIALLYNAFKISCNITGQKRIILFIGSMILSETGTQLILFFLYQYSPK